ILMEKLKNEIFTLLKESGAELMGVADLSDIPESPYPTGICFMMPVPKHIIKDLLEAPTKEYHQMYIDYNGKLNEMGEKVASLLQEKGYNALANTTDKVIWDKATHSTTLPHKTVATKAGLGWIGKSCILVTKDFGGAFRMSVVLTDAPLPADEPITESQCGGCTKCVDACPAQCLKNTLWKAGMAREEIADVFACDETMRKNMMERHGYEMTICGKCFAVCPYTQRYLNK
ncbi:MAG: epoxyqueuosine reductase, partial [Anaerotignum sp.]|nr:epoxyqueuosine reductase [Anaerotignum sp.]